MGLIGKEMFAIDGCKLRSNASKEWSGTKADFRKKAAMMERAVEAMVEPPAIYEPVPRRPKMSGRIEYIAA